MKIALLSGLGFLLASAGGASAQAYYAQPGYGGAPQPAYSPCPPDYHQGPQGCVCNETATFYSPSASGYYPTGASVPGYSGQSGYNGSNGYNVHLYAPGVRVIGQPVDVASGNVYVQGAPVYVQAPPVHVASPQVYLQRPQVYVQPSQVTVDPPTVHIAGCSNGSSCEMVGTSYPH